MRVSTLLRRCVAVPAGVVLLAALAAGPADAHAVLVSTNPVDGANLGAAPSRLTLTFDEAVDVGSTVVRLFDEAGRGLVVGEPVSAPVAGAEEATSIEAALPALSTGRYLIRWQSVTSDDFHPVDGALTFGVGEDVQAAGTPPSRGLAAPWEAAARFGVLAGYAAAVGGLALLVLLRPLLLRRGSARRVVVRGSTGGSVVAALGLLVLEGWLTISSGAVPSPAFLGYWSAAVVALLALAGAVLAVDRALDRRPHPLLAATGAGAVLLGAWGLGHLGHGSSSAGSVLTTMHVAAAACWAGGLAVLVPASLAARRAGDPGWAREAVAAFARIAIPALALSVLSGALLARQLVPGWGGLSDTTYGRSLALKLGLVALAVTLGAWTAWKARATAPDRRVGGRLTGELAAVAVVLVLAAALAGGQPPDDRRWQPSPVADPTTSVTGTEVDDLLVTLLLTPGSPGPNFATVRVLDQRRPAPAPVAAVLVDDGTGGPVAAARQDDADWLVPLALDRSGPLSVSVTVQRPGWDDARTTFRWQVAPVPGTEQGGLDISGAWLALAVAGVAGGLCVGALAAWLGRRRRDDAPADETPEQAAQPGLTARPSTCRPSTVDRRQACFGDVTATASGRDQRGPRRRGDTLLGPGDGGRHRGVSRSRLGGEGHAGEPRRDAGAGSARRPAARPPRRACAPAPARRRGDRARGSGSPPAPRRPRR